MVDKCSGTCHTMSVFERGHDTLHAYMYISMCVGVYIRTACTFVGVNASVCSIFQSRVPDGRNRSSNLISSQDLLICGSF